jgi:hypothetical protein
MKQITILSQDRKDLFGAQSIATITTDSHDKAMKTLQNYADLQVVSEDALIVRVQDEMGALAKLAHRFSAAHIHIRSLRFVERHQGYALVAISTERSDSALEIVRDILVS